MDTPIFDREITVFRNHYSSECEVVPLRNFLFDTHHVQQIMALRATDDEAVRKHMKLTLPAATISGVFKGRLQGDLVQHSGLICVDIDGKDNPGLDMAEAKRRLSANNRIAYIGTSVGGAGLFCIIPIANPLRHREHFRALQDDFKALGIVIDAQCINVNKLRCLSYDPAPYVNEVALPYYHFRRSQRKSRKPRPLQPCDSLSKDKTIRQVYALCREIEQRGLDITDSYDDWFHLGMALADLGEDGREVFHRISSMSPKYNERETEKKFDYYLRYRREITIGTFFEICKRNGVSLGEGASLR